jgi:hypothetical protein
VTRCAVLVPAAVCALSGCGLGGGSTASQGGSTTLVVTVQGSTTTIVQDLQLTSTVPLTAYTQGRLLYDPPEGGLVSGTLLDATATQVLAAGDRQLQAKVTGSPAGLTLTGMQASRSEHLRVTYRVAGLLRGLVLTVPTPGSTVGRWSTVEVDVDVPADAGQVSIAASSRTVVADNAATGPGWRYVLHDVPGGSPAATVTTLR